MHLLPPREVAMLDVLCLTMLYLTSSIHKTCTYMYKYLLNGTVLKPQRQPKYYSH